MNRYHVNLPDYFTWSKRFRFRCCWFPPDPLYRTKVSKREAKANDCAKAVAKTSQLCYRPDMNTTHNPAMGGAPLIEFEAFLAVDIRIGRVISATPLEGARKPAYVLSIDFGPAIGVRKSSAQITEHYTPEELPGRRVAAVVNFPPRQIGKIMSEVLTLGFPDADGAVVLFAPDREVPIGSRLF
jgi:tRNA-binding protein